MHFRKSVDSIKYDIFKNGFFRDVKMKLWAININHRSRIDIWKLPLGGSDRNTVHIEPCFVIGCPREILRFIRIAVHSQYTQIDVVGLRICVLHALQPTE
jgi:hypothetical protein